MKKALLCFSFLALGGGLWLVEINAGSGRWFERSQGEELGSLAVGRAKEAEVQTGHVLGTSRKETSLQQTTNQLINRLLANNWEGIYELLSEDLKATFKSSALTGIGSKVTEAELVGRPELSGDWAEAVIELNPGGEANSGDYLAIFHWEDGWKLFATQKLR